MGPVAIRNVRGPCSAGGDCSARRERFWEKAAWMWMCCRWLRASLAKFSTKEKNPGFFSLPPQIGLKQAVLLTYSDILVSCAESGKISHLGIFWLLVALSVTVDNVFIPQPCLTLYPIPSGFCPCFCHWCVWIYRSVSLGYRGEFWGSRGSYLLSHHWVWDIGADLGSGLFKTCPWFLVKVAGAHNFMLKDRYSSLLTELHMHANPSHHC